MEERLMSFADQLKLTGAQDVDYARCALDVYRMCGLFLANLDFLAENPKGNFRDSLDARTLAEVECTEWHLVKLTQKHQSYETAKKIYKEVML